MGEALMNKHTTDRKFDAEASIPVFAFSGAASGKNTMKYAAIIDPKNAIRDNGSKAGLVTAEIDLGSFSEAERAALVACDCFRPSNLPDDAAFYHRYPRGVLDAPNLLAAVREQMAHAAWEREDHMKSVAADIERARAAIAAGKLPFCAYSEAKEIVSQMPEYLALKELEDRAREEEKAAKARAAEEARKAEEDAKSRRKAERIAWINAHGSARLRRCQAENIEHGAIYADERLAAERPGWLWWSDVPGDDSEPRNPNEAAFAMLDEARKTAPDAKLVYVASEAETDDETGEETKPAEYGYAALASFLGRQIVFGWPK